MKTVEKVVLWTVVAVVVVGVLYHHPVWGCEGADVVSKGIVVGDNPVDVLRKMGYL